MTAAFTLAAASAFAADSSTAGRAVLALDQKWADAESRGDIAAVRLLLDERFLATFDGSKPLGKTEFLRAVFGGEPAGTEVQTLSERTLVVAGQTAVVLETDTVASKKAGQVARHAYRLTATYM